MRFEKLLDLIDVQKEFGGPMKVEEKVKKFYDLLEATTALVSQKRKNFSEETLAASRMLSNL